MPGHILLTAELRRRGDSGLVGWTSGRHTNIVLLYVNVWTLRLLHTIHRR